jgi:Predicted membrane protein
MKVGYFMRRQLFYIPFSLTFLLLLVLILIFGLSFLFFGVIVSAFTKIGFSIENAHFSSCYYPSLEAA